MAAGMLPGGFFTPQYRDVRADEQDQERTLQNLAADPTAATAYASYAGMRQAGRGLGTAVAEGMGLDARSPAQKNMDAVQAAKAQVAKLGFSPDDPQSIDNFYKNVIQILQQQGLAAEALEVAKEWRQKQRDDKLSDLKVREAGRKEAKDAATAQYQSDRNEVLRQKGIPEFQKYMDQLELTADPMQRQMLMDRLNYMMGKSGKGVKAVDYGDHVEVVDAATGQPISIGDKGAAPMNAKDQAKNDQQKNQIETKYDQAKASLQADYNAAVELYNMPGLKDAVGVVAGASAKGAGTSFLDMANRFRIGEAGRAALAKIQQVQGGTFLAALQDLKQQSATGATGLGSLTEVEGSKVQSAKAALDPQQGYDSYRANLAQYISTLEAAGDRLDEGAQRSGITDLRPLQKHPLQAAPAAPAARAPRPAPAAPTPSAPTAAPSVESPDDRVRVKMPDGRLGTIPRANLAAAKAKGAVEAQ